MRGMTIVRGVVPAVIAASGGQGAQFLLTPDPKEVWDGAPAPARAIDIDLGGEQSFDTVFLGFTNAAPGAAWSIEATSSMNYGDPVMVLAPTPMASNSLAPRPGSIALLGQSVQTRYLRINFAQAEGAGSPQAGVILIGRRFEAPYEYKSGRRPIDLSERVDLAGGGFGFGRAARKAGFRFTFADLSDEDVEELWNLTMETGNQHPVLLVEGGGDPILQSQIHYCVFDRFEAFERSDPADTRWALSVTDWI